MTTVTVTGIDLLEYEFQGEARVFAHARLGTASGTSLLGMVWDSADGRVAAALHENIDDRPLTHDLAHALIEGLGAQVKSASIDRLVGDIYFGTVNITTGEKRLALDARPSDAIILAIRAGAEIKIGPTVAEAAGPKASIRTPEELDRYQAERGRFLVRREPLWDAT